jgi:hypothetical protein
LHEGTSFSLAVFKLRAQFEVPFDKHLEFVLVHLRVKFTAANLAQVSNCNGLASNRAHLDGVPESKLMVNA